MFCSRRMGSSVPRAVVVSAMETGTNACTNPMAASPPTITTAAIALMTQDVSAWRPAFSRRRRGSSS